MRLLLAAILVCASLGGCSGAEDRPPGGEPFGFDDWVGGIEYVLIVEMTEGPRSAESRDYVEWSGTVAGVEWQRKTTTEAGRLQAVVPPTPGDRVDLVLGDTIEVSTGATVVVLVNDVDFPDGLRRLVNVAMDSDWQPLPGSLEPAVAGLEDAAALTPISDRRGAVLTVLQDVNT